MPKDVIDKYGIPEGRRPEEFLNDERLAEYHAARLADAKETDPEYPELARAAAKARVAAALTAAAAADANADAAVAAKKK